MSTSSFSSILSNSSINSTSDEIEILDKIGQGAFGQIFIGKMPNSPKQYAVKLEYNDGFYANEHKQIQQEAQVYQILDLNSKSMQNQKQNNFCKSVTNINKLSPCNILSGIPNAYCYKQHQHEGEHMLVMDLLGPSLEELFRLCKKRFSPKTVAMLAVQMITRVEFIHKCNIIHQDIKPSNFVMGCDETRQQQDTVYIIDFGLSKSFKTQNNEHIPLSNGHDLIGNARYASLNNHTGIAQSRRDDLESLGYIFVYFLTSSLPWIGNYEDISEDEMFNIIYKKKLSTSSKHFSFEGIPSEFQQYINYCRKLGFFEQPDYQFLRNLMLDFMRKNAYEMDYQYDWLDLWSDWKELDGYKAKARRFQNQQFQYQNNDAILEQLKKEFNNKHSHLQQQQQINVTTIENIHKKRKSKSKNNVFLKIFKDFCRKFEESDFDWLVIAEKMTQDIFGNKQQKVNQQLQESQQKENKFHNKTNTNYS